MSRVDLIRSVISEKLDDAYSLLALRVLFPPERVAVRIEDEVDDLYVYPERLKASYEDEWRIIATRAIFEQAFTDSAGSDEENLEHFVRYLIEEAIPHCIRQHPRLFRNLDSILQIIESENTVTFPDPGRRELMKLIWPEV